jgi:hypothetical protein
LLLVPFQRFEEALKLKKEAKKKQKGQGGGTDESNSGTPQVSIYLHSCAKKYRKLVCME